MKIFRLFLLIFSFISLFCTQLFSSDFGLGVTGGYLKSFIDYNYSYISQFNRLDFNVCFSESEGDGYHFGLIANFPVSKKFLKIDLNPRLTFESMIFYNGKNADKYSKIYHTDTGDISVEIQSIYSSILDLNYINISLPIKISLLDIPIGLMIGPCLSFITYTNYKERYRLITPINHQFERLNPNDTEHPENSTFTYESNDRDLVFYNNDLPNTYFYRVSLILGVFGDIEMGDFVLSPYIIYDYGLTAISTAKCSNQSTTTSVDKDWQFKAINFGFDILWNF